MHADFGPLLVLAVVGYVISQIAGGSSGGSSGSSGGSSRDSSSDDDRDFGGVGTWVDDAPDYDDGGGDGM